MHPLQFLQAWYQARSNGLWERTHGVTIESLDNPGWMVTIDLEGTPLENRAMPLLQREASPLDWLVCEVNFNRFRGQGDPAKLLPILQVFQAWAETTAAETAPE
jgi:hypothetical protein